MKLRAFLFVCWTSLVCIGVSFAQSLPVGTRVFKPEQFAAVDKYARETPDMYASSVESLAAYLAKGTKNDVEKARAIYVWNAYHIAYNTHYLLATLDDDHSLDSTLVTEPKDVLRTRLTVCAGYASLYKALADAMGLKCELVICVVRGMYYRNDRTRPVGHAYNAVCIDGYWYIVDSTAGAGFSALDRRKYRLFSNYWFLNSPENMKYFYFPDDSKWQLLEKPMTYEEFLKLPELPPDFFGTNYLLKTGDFDASLTAGPNYGSPGIRGSGRFEYIYGEYDFGHATAAELSFGVEAKLTANSGGTTEDLSYPATVSVGILNPIHYSLKALNIGGIFDNVDVFVGLGLGAEGAFYTDGTSYFWVTGVASVGFSYFVSDQIAVMCDLCDDYSGFSLGVQFRF